MKSTIFALVALAVAVSAKANAAKKTTKKVSAPSRSTTSTFKDSLETEEAWNRFKGDVADHIKGANKLRRGREDKVRVYFRRVDAQRAAAKVLKSAIKNHSNKVAARKRADSRLRAARQHASKMKDARDRANNHLSN